MMVLDRAPARAHKPRDIGLDSLRGLAAVLMVAGHVIGSSSTRGMEVSDDSVWRLSHLLLEDLRMPLFTVLSGFVFAMRPLPDLTAWPRMIAGKSRRLVVPLLVVAPAYMAAQAIVPDTNRAPDLVDLVQFLFLPYEHFWFLQSIFVIFATVGVLDAIGLLSRPRAWACVFGVSCLANLTVSLPNDADLFSTNGTARILPFFILGYGLKQFSPGVHRRPLLHASAIVFACSYGATVLTHVHETDLSTLADRSLSLCVAISGITVLVLTRAAITVSWLAWIGYFSFGIYLLHVFGTAPVRIALESLSLDHQPLVFTASVLVGVLVPILAQLTVGNVRWVSWAVFGQAPATPPPLHPHGGPTDSSPGPSR